MTVPSQTRSLTAPACASRTPARASTCQAAPGSLIYDLGQASLWGWFSSQQDWSGYPNLQPNSGFEDAADGDQIPDGWTINPAAAVRDTAKAHSGAASLRIDAPDFPSGGAYHLRGPLVPVEGGRTYHLLAHLAGDVSEGAFAMMITYYNSATGEAIGAGEPGAAASTGGLQPYGYVRYAGAHFPEWTVLDETFTANLPPGADSLGIDLAIIGHGPLWVDDLRLFSDSPTAVETRSSTDGTTWSDWTGLSEPPRPFAENQVAIGSPQGRYLQFRVHLSTADSAWTPRISELAFTFARAFPFTIDLVDAQRRVFLPPKDPVGRHGRVAIGASGRLQFEDGTAARFWATQNTDLLNGRGADICAFADAFGFNMVKTQRSYNLGEDIRDPGIIGHFDSLIAECGPRGIYVYLRFWAVRRIIDADTLDNAKFNTHGVGSEEFFNPQLLDITKQYVTDVLTHVNPYTGVAIGADPAVVFVEYLNEEGMVQAFIADKLHAEHLDSPFPRDIGPEHSALLTGQWNAWLQTKYADRAALEAAWLEPGKTGLAADESPWPGPGLVPAARLRYSERGQYTRARFRDTVRFYVETEENFYGQMAAHIAQTKAGLGVPLTAAPLTIGTQALPYYSRAAVSPQVLNNVVDVHSYFDHPSGTNDLQRLSQLQNPIRAAIPYAARARVLGKPFTVSEHNQPIHTEYSAEMPVVGSAYGAFQGYDMVTDFAMSTWSHNYFVDNFDPARMAQTPVAHNLFVRDMQPAAATIELQYTPNETLNIDTVQVGLLGLGPAGFLSEEYALLHGVGVRRFDAAAVMSRDEYLTQYGLPPEPASPYVSDTGQLALDTAQGTLTINTPGTQGAVGRLAGATHTLPAVAFDVPASPLETVSLLVTALDTADLTTASSQLLVAAGKSEHTGLRYSADKRKWLDFGATPFLTAGVKATITLSVGTTGVSVWPLDASGQRAAPPLPLTVQGDGVRFALDPSYQTVWYEIEVNRGPPASPADVTGDGHVNILDLFAVSQDFRKAAGQRVWPRSDVDGDGNVDIIDLVLVAREAVFGS